MISPWRFNSLAAWEYLMLQIKCLVKLKQETALFFLLGWIFTTVICSETKFCLDSRRWGEEQRKKESRYKLWMQGSAECSSTLVCKRYLLLVFFLSIFFGRSFVIAFSKNNFRLHTGCRKGRERFFLRRLKDEIHLKRRDRTEGQVTRREGDNLA